MQKKTRLLLLGFLSWLIPFVVAILIFKLRESNRAFFETIMAVTVASSTTWLAVLYFKQIKLRFIAEGLTIGIVWFVINLGIDLLMFMQGPMKMPLAQYMMDIGLTYLMIPAITTGLGVALEQHRT
ncbi:MAG: hypothetical protein HYR56_18695 [Acidobacteria bacterium]|nr:hypothetical protein [Acidobacteriota bacterium]MBI3427187.1 hypothetical protein [Acidobacteriota bacterium]